MPGRKRIIILGGGMGALSAACGLTSAPDWQQHYDVTVYQLGWRLGGKCASSRNASHAGRIEEHGLHVWFGFYENAFALLRSCYDALGRPSPLAAGVGMFEQRTDFRLFEQAAASWLPRDLPFPVHDGEPGAAGNPEPTEWSIVVALAEFAEGFVRHWLRRAPATVQPESFAAQASGLQLRAQLEGLPADPALHTPFQRELLASSLRSLRALIKSVATALQASDPDWERVRMIADLCLTTAIGVVEDDLVQRGLASISHLELLAWLRSHGADAATADVSRCVPLRALYDTCFAFDEGDVTRPDFAAGVAIGVALRIGLSYRGAPAYLMRAGMGEVVIAPLFELLRQRGVQFEFFQRVERIEADATGNRITRIHFARQANLKNPAAGYDPLRRDAETPYWPDQPKYELLEEGDALQAAGINLESHWYPPQRPGEARWQLEPGPDDQVVLGISLGALPFLCADLAAKNARWQALLKDLPTIQTQSMQLWLRKSSAQLGWSGPAGTRPTAVAGPEPHDVWADMSQLLRVERWPAADAPASVHYFCGPMTHDYLAHSADDPAAPQLALAQVRATAQQWLGNFAGWLLPGAATPGSKAIDWDVLHADARAHGPERLDAQWLRANIDPSERYVLSPGGRNAARLAPDDSGFANLVLAGDWTRTSINAGCVEAAVMSGMAASRHLCGAPAAIYGERFLQG